MAESVTYQGRRVALRIPEAKAFEAEATARGLGQLRQSLDRMTAFAAEQNKIKAKQEGEEYGAANAPTLKQIQDAKKTGEELQLPGNKNTLFGRAARAAAANIVSTELELAAKTEMDQVILSYSQGDRLRNPTDLQDKLDAIIQGYSATFDESVPSIARSMKAKLALSANAKYTAYHGKYITEQKVKSQADFMKLVIADIDNMPELFNTKFTATKADGSTEQTFITREIFDALKMTMLDDGSKLGMTDADLRTMATLWDAGVKEAALQVINDEASILGTTDGKYAFYKNLQRGVFLEDKVKGAMGVLVSQEDRAKAIKVARDMWEQDLADNNAIINFETTRHSENVRISEQAVNKAFFNYASATTANDRDKAFRIYERAVNELKTFDAAKANQHLPNLERINLNGQTFIAPPTDDKTTAAAIEKSLNNFDETLSLTDIDKAFMEEKLTLKSYQEFSQRLNENLDQNFKNMLLDARVILELPPPNSFAMFNSGKENVQRLNKLAEFDSLARAERRRLKENFDPRVFFEENKGMLTEAPTETESIENKIKDIKEEFPSITALENKLNLYEPDSEDRKILQKKLDFMKENGGYD